MLRQVECGLKGKNLSAGSGGTAHTTLYGLDRDYRVLLQEHRAADHATHSSTMKHLEDQSHLILDTPPAVAKQHKTVSPSIESSLRKVQSLQVMPPPNRCDTM
jgi:hypothetical protein